MGDCFDVSAPAQLKSRIMVNTLYYGDNLEILRNQVPDEWVDLVYLDPPFNSNANYNVLFKEMTEGAVARAEGGLANGAGVGVQ